MASWFGKRTASAVRTRREGYGLPLITTQAKGAALPLITTRGKGTALAVPIRPKKIWGFSP